MKNTKKANPKDLFILGVLVTVLLQSAILIWGISNYETIRAFAFQKGYLGIGEPGIFKHLNSVPRNLVSYFSISQEVADTWIIDIKFKQYEKLRSKVSDSRRAGVIKQTGDDWVRATISADGEVYPVNLRIKG